MFKRSKVTLLGLVILLVGSFLITGCGNAAEKTGVEVNSLDRVKEAGEISFAMSGGYPPFNYFDEDNNLVGFDVDVCKEVADRLGLEFKPVTTEWSGIIPGLTSGVYDGILGSMAIRPDREEVVSFSVPYYYSVAQVIVKKSSLFQDSTELKGKKVGMATGTTYEEDAKALGAEIKLYKDDNLTMMELNSGSIDAVITDRSVAVNAIDNGKFDFRLLGDPLRSEDIAVAFRKEDKELRQAVDEIIQSMHEDGTLKKISEKWLKRDISTK